LLRISYDTHAASYQNSARMEISSDDIAGSRE